MLPDKNLRQPLKWMTKAFSGTAAAWKLAAALCIPLVSSHCAAMADQYKTFAVQLKKFCFLVRTSNTQVCNMTRRRQETATDCEMCPCRAVGLPYLRYDSVMGTHPDGNVPVYITYHEACGYPRYLVTYTSTAR